MTISFLFRHSFIPSPFSYFIPKSFVMATTLSTLVEVVAPLGADRFVVVVIHPLLEGRRLGLTENYRSRKAKFKAIG